MQLAVYNVLQGGNVELWRDISARITISGVDDVTGNWKLYIDNDYYDGVVLIGDVTALNNNLIATISVMNTLLLANAIRGKQALECKATLTNDVDKVYIFTLIIKNRGLLGNPVPLQSYYTKSQTDNKFATKEVVNADIDNLAENYWTKAEVAEQIANIEKLGIEVVEQLPPASEGELFTVYLVPILGETNNVYELYLLINNEWLLIGTTAVVLSNYIPKLGDFGIPLSENVVVINLTNAAGNIVKYHIAGGIGYITIGSEANSSFYTILSGRQTRITGSISVSVNTPVVNLNKVNNALVINIGGKKIYDASTEDFSLPANLAVTGDVTFTPTGGTQTTLTALLARILALLQQLQNS